MSYAEDGSGCGMATPGCVHGDDGVANHNGSGNRAGQREQVAG